MPKTHSIKPYPTILQGATQTKKFLFNLIKLLQCVNPLLQCVNPLVNPFYFLTNEEFLYECELERKQNVNINANHLNLIYSDRDTPDDKDYETNCLTAIAQEQYVEITDVNSLMFNNNINETFTILSANVRSLVNPRNFSKLESMIAGLDFQPDIICITETWIKPLISGQYKNLNGYKFVSNHRSVCKGGGVGIYVKNSLTFNVCDDLTIMQEKIFESIFIDIKLSTGNVVCGTIYRSPSNDLISNDSFLKTLKKCHNILQPNKICYITGDFNYDLANFDDVSVSNFTELMFENSFFPVINQPTRISDTTATVLDHIWTNTIKHSINAGILTCPISDHLPVLACTNIQPNKQCEDQKYTRVFSSNNIIKFNNEIQSIYLEPILNSTSPNDALDLLVTDYKQSFDKCFPLTTVKTKLPNNTWFDDELKDLLRIKNRLYKKYLLKKTPVSKHEFNKIRNKYFHVLKEKKKSHFEKIFQQHKSNIKETWKIINKLLGKTKTSHCSSLNIDNNQLSTDKLAIANHFNNHFANIASKLVNDLPTPTKHYSEYLNSPIYQTIYLNPTTTMEIKNIIGEMKNKRSCGLDGIPSVVLKQFPEKILVALSHIFNLSLSLGIFPCRFKTAKVIPVFKKGSPNDVNNYRPISLLPVMSKILEKVMYKRVLSFLNQHQFFYDGQFGFRKKHGTNHALTLLVENITEGFENKQSVLGIFLDLSKAFDTIDHNILINKLQHYGIRGLAGDWFRSYLNTRYQHVQIDNMLSESATIQHGVPQGSILGPLLFLIYVNDLPKCTTNGKSIMFADDTSIFFKGNCCKSLYNVANQDLQSIDAWLISNKLSLNVNKSNHILFQTANCKVLPNINLKLRGKIVKKVRSAKFLGVTIDDLIRKTR